jgi:Tfp pilus assembly protein PilZ
MSTSKETSGTSLRAQRAPVPRVETAVTMRSESHFFVDRYGDVKGIFVATLRDFAVGEETLVEVALHSYVLLLRGKVLWRSAGDGGLPCGIGVGFDDLTVPARWVIESFCARRPAARYDLDEQRSACG